MKTIDQNKAYKLKQKIEKSVLTNTEKYHKRCIAERMKYERLKELQVSKITIRYDKKLEKRLSKIGKIYDRSRINKKKKILGKEIKIKLPSLGKMKEKALTVIQLYAKLNRAVLLTTGIRIYLYDKQIRVYLDKNVNWGHVYGQRNYPNMAFEVDNIRPISSWSNKQQWDQIAQWKENLPKDIQNKLWNFSKNLEAKNKLRDHKFYQWIIDKYVPLVLEEQKRLGII